MRAVVAIVSITLVTRAWGAPDRASALYEQGVRAYNVGRYAEAAQSFQAAYVISGQPGLLFNIAQSFRQQGDCGQALEFYRSYLRAKPDGDPGGAVTRRISEMEACVATHERGKENAPPAPAVAPRSDADPHAERRAWLPWTFAGAGVAFVGSGVALYAWTKSSVDDCAPRCSPTRLDTLHLRADLAYGCAAIGAVSLVAAGWLWWRGSSHDRSGVGIAATPGQAYVWGVF